MSKELEPMSPDLRALLEGEKSIDVSVPVGAEDRALAMVRALAALPPAASSPDAQGADASSASGAQPAPAAQASVPAAPVAPAAALIGAKGVVIAAVSASLGAFGGAAWQRTQEKPVPAPIVQVVQAPVVAAQIIEDAAVAPAPDAALAVIAPQPQRVERGNRAPVPATPEPELAQQAEISPDSAGERQLIDGAREALGRGRPHDALVFLMNHERRFAEGVLQEEREVLVIEALVAESRLDRARDRAARFEQSYPRSTYLRRVRELVAAAQ